jgi:hypothetical protein
MTDCETMAARKTLAERGRSNIKLCAETDETDGPRAYASAP